MSIGLARLREEPDRIRQGAIDKGEDPSVVDAALALEARRRQLLGDSDRLKAERNAASKQIGEAIRAGAAPNGPGVAALRQASTEAGTQIDKLDAELAAAEAQLEEMLLRIPNPADPDVPVGDASANQTVRTWGAQLPKEVTADGRTWTRRPHWEVAADLRMFDLERGAKITGSGFPVYTGPGSHLQRALIDFMLDVHTEEHGMTEIWPPAVVNSASARGTGQIPDKEDLMYVVGRDDLYLVPTAEVPVTNLHRDEIFEADQLPIRYAAYSPCFRREAGAAGKDTRGILRVHQFDKVEMVFFEKPEASADALEWLTGRPRLSSAAHGHQRHGLRPGQEVRPGSLGARRRALARGQLVLELPRLPGPPDGDPLPARTRRQARTRPHAQRLRAGPAANRGRHPRVVSAAGRQPGRSGCPPAIHANRPDRALGSVAKTDVRCGHVRIWTDFCQDEVAHAVSGRRAAASARHGGSDGSDRSSRGAVEPPRVRRGRRGSGRRRLRG
jgi:seryl-tRNA synthetase